jgi:hypothetical protein
MFLVSAVNGVDLSATSVGASASTLYDGDKVTLYTTIRNYGSNPASGYSVTFYVNGAKIEDVQSKSSIAAGGMAIVTSSAKWETYFGSHKISARVSFKGDADATNDLFKGRVRVLDEVNPQPPVDDDTSGMGASMPYKSYEAEDGTVGGGAEKILDDGDRLPGTLNGEASKRSAVKIDSVGEYVQWTAKEKANSIVIRNCIPPQSTYTISLYVNNAKKGTITLDSNHCWLNNSDDLSPGRIPQGGGKLDGTCKHIYDENHKLLDFTINAGDTVKLQKDNGDNAQWYGIDFIDLEMVAPKKNKPSNLLSIADCGAQSGGANCFNAIQSAITQAISQGYKGIWIPEGEWYVMGTENNRKISLPENTPSDFEVSGAGMWYSKLCAIEPEKWGDDWGNFGFNCMGKTCYWHDFSMWGAGLQRIEGGKPFVNAFGAYSKFENLWIEHTTCGFWCGGAMVDFYNSMKGNDDASVKARQSYGLSIKDCRVRNTGADGINLCVGTSHATIDNVDIRSTGDDCFATWSQEESFILSSDHNKNGCEGNVFKNCTGRLPWRANCFGVYGGKDNSVINCVAEDALVYCGIYMTVESYQSVPYSGTVTYKDMVINRCSGRFWGDRCFPAIWFEKTKTGNIVLENVDVTDSLYTPLWVYGQNTVTMKNVKFDGFCKYKTDKAKPGNDYQLGAIYSEGAQGSYTFNNVNFYNHGGHGANGESRFWAPWNEVMGGTLNIGNDCNFTNTPGGWK